MVQNDTILNLLNIRKQEKSLVFLLLAYSFSIGVGLYMYYTAATTLFLTKFDNSMLPLAYITGGVFVYCIARSNALLQKYIKFSSLSTGLVALLIVSIATLLIAYKVTENRWIVFLLFLWIRANLFVFSYTFWVSASRVFDLGQAKRLYGLLGLGEVLSSIVANYLVKFFISEKITQVEGLLDIGLGFICFSFVFIVLIVRKNKENLSFKNSIPKNAKQTSSLLQKKYHPLMYLLGLLPIACLYIIEYSFSVDSKINFPDKDQLAIFLSQFIFICSIIELLVKVVLFRFVTKTYGVMSGLILLPVALIAVTVLTLLMTFLNIKFFFLVLLSRFLITSIRRAFSDTSYQLLYQPIPKEESIQLQNRVETYAKPLGYILAGLSLLILGNFHISNTVTISLFLLALLLVWLTISLLMKKYYRLTLLNTLSVGSSQVVAEIKKSFTGLTQTQLDNKIPFSTIISLTESSNPSERVKSALLLAQSGKFAAAKYMARLLEDKDHTVRMAALSASTEMNKVELIPSIISNISFSELRACTLNTLLKIGDPVMDYINDYFNKSKNNREILYALIKLAENIGGPKAIRFLRSKLNHPQPELVDRVIQALNKLDYTPNSTEESLIVSKIDQKIDLYLWLVAAGNDIKIKNKSLADSLNKERENLISKLINLLVLFHRDNQFYNIENLFYETKGHTKSYLTDLMGLLIPSEEIKARVLSLFDTLSDQELLISYDQKYPQQSLESENRLLAIINKDNLSVWTKSTALKALLLYRDEKTARAFAAHSTSTSLLLSETALFGLLQLNQNRFLELKDFFSYQSDTFHSQICENASRYKTSHELTVSKAEVLSETGFITEFSIETIISLSSQVTYYFSQKNNYLSSMLLNEHNLSYSGIIIGEGTIKAIFSNGEETTFSSRDIYWTSFKAKSIIAVEDSHLYFVTPALSINAPMPEESLANS